MSGQTFPSDKMSKSSDYFSICSICLIFAVYFMTSLIKSADVSKILTSDEIFLYFSRHVMLVYKRAKRHLLCCLINDFMEGGLNQPPPKPELHPKAQTG